MIKQVVKGEWVKCGNDIKEEELGVLFGSKKTVILDLKYVFI